MNRLTAVCAAFAAGMAFTTVAVAADLPKATQKMLKALKLDPSILNGVDQELVVPKAWMDAALKEGQVDIYSTHPAQGLEEDRRRLDARYPKIKLNQQEVRTSATAATSRPLAAFKEGRYLVDITIGLSGNVYLFRRAGAFADLSDLPNYKVIPEEVRQKDGIAVATRTRYWCLTYNTNKVKKSELPKTWDDLVNGDRFAGKNCDRQPAQQLAPPCGRPRATIGARSSPGSSWSTSSHSCARRA